MMRSSYHHLLRRARPSSRPMFRQQRSQATTVDLLHHSHLHGATNDDSSERHEAVRMFLDTLRVAASVGMGKTTTNRMTSEPFLQDVWKEAQPQQWQEKQTLETVDNAVSSNQALEVPETQKAMTDAAATDDQSLRSVSETIPKDDDPLKNLLSELGRTIRHRQATEALKNFRKFQRQHKDSVVPAKMTSDLFFLLSQKDQLSAYDVLLYYNTHHSDSHDDGKWLPMYKRICTAVGSLDLDKSSRRDTYNFAVALLEDVEAMDLEAKRLLYPSLVISFAKQRRVFLGRFAHKIYDAMVENEFQMKMGWLIKLLSLSRYNRQDDLPFHDILERAVNMGATLHSSVLLPVIHNMFPYTDTEKMCVTLRALVNIETAKQQGKGERNHGLHRKDYNRIDMATLEMISTSAAKMGDASLILLVWDVLNIADHEPSETIFENTVLAFAANQADGLPQAFVALESMKEYGFEPSRALLRSFSYFIRNELSTVDHALDTVLQTNTVNESDDIFAMENQSLVSLESLNVVMSGYAERGETDETLAILKTMDEIGIVPNEDSFSFAIEVLGKDIHRRKLTKDLSRIHRNLEIADTLLTRMEKCDIDPSSFIIRQYVELLCLAGEVDTATDVVEKRIADDADRSRSSVCNKTIYRVASENLSMGNIEKAKQLARMMSETNAPLIRKISSKQQRASHLARVESGSL